MLAGDKQDQCCSPRAGHDPVEQSMVDRLYSMYAHKNGADNEVDKGENRSASFLHSSMVRYSCQSSAEVKRYTPQSRSRVTLIAHD